MNNPRAFIAIVVAIALVWITSEVVNRSDEAPPDSKRYSNREMNFSIRFPDGWALQEHSDAYSNPANQEEFILGGSGNVLHYIEAYDPLSGGFNDYHSTISVATENLPHSMSSDFYADAMRVRLKTAFSQFMEEGSGKAELGNIQANWTAFTHRIVRSGEKDRFIKSIVFYANNEKVGVTIMCHAEPKSFVQLEPLFRQVAGSFWYEG